MNDRQALSSEKRFLSPKRGSNPQPSDDQKIVGLIPVWGSEIVFLRIEFDDRSSIISMFVSERLIGLESKQNDVMTLAMTVTSCRSRTQNVVC